MITKETRDVYICTDGAEFQDEAMAIGHEAIINHQDLIDGFLGSLGDKYRPKTQTLLRGVLFEYVVYAEQQKAVSLLKNRPISS